MRFIISVLTSLMLLTASFNAGAVYSCGGVNDTCTCGAYNPYPCCDNGGNCTWYAWHSACCHWGMALPGWGNANTWAQYAAANPNYEVLSSPVVGAIAARTLGTYGHVAFVVGVSGASITVEEENCCTSCAAGVRTWTYDASYFDAGFIIPVGGVTPPPCSIEIAGQPVIIDDQSDCFERHGTYWWDEATGNDSHAFYTFATDDSLPDSWASWRLNVTVAGNYEITALVPPSANDLTQNAVYTVSHQGSETNVTVNQSTSVSQWVSLGQFWLEEGTAQFVKLNDNTGEAYALRRVLMFDALGVAPVTECTDECDTPDEVVCDGANGFKTCGEFDGDDCLEWSAVNFCGTGEICTVGVCHLDEGSCDDECTQEGIFCATATATHRCGEFDEDSCLEYGEFTECDPGEVCQFRACRSSTDAGTDSNSDGEIDSDGSTDTGAHSTGCSCKSAGARRRTPWTAFLPVVVLLTFVVMWFKKRKKHRDD